MTLFRQIATSRPWWRMVPEQGLFASGGGCEQTLNAGQRAIDGTCAMAYLSSPCHVLLQLDKVVTRRVKATFVNPADGTEVDAGMHDTGYEQGTIFPRGLTQWFSPPPRWEDAVLILDGAD